jgi:hypothetical protein
VRVGRLTEAAALAARSHQPPKRLEAEPPLALKGCELASGHPKVLLRAMSSVTTNLVPQFDVTVHIVLDDFDEAGRAYRETDEQAADFDTVVDNLMTGQFANPVRVIAFNTSEGWSRDVSEDVARQVLKRAVKEGKPLPRASRHFIEFHVSEEELLRAGVAD